MKETAANSFNGYLAFCIAQAGGAISEAMRIDSNLTLQINSTSALTTKQNKLNVNCTQGAVASATSLAWQGILFNASTLSVTGATAVTTATGLNLFEVLAPTIAGNTATCTITYSATMIISGAPVAGANVTITNPYALWIQAGNVRIASLAGTGSRPVVADTNGVLSAL
jgi:hypothetical protein